MTNGLSVLLPSQLSWHHRYTAVGMPEDRAHLGTKAIKHCGTIMVLKRGFICYFRMQRKLVIASHKCFKWIHTPSTSYLYYT